MINKIFKIIDNVKVTNNDCLQITSNKGFGRYEHKSNMLKLKKNKKGLYVIINKEKHYLKDLKQIEDYRWLYSDKEYGIVSQFFIEL